MTTQSAHHDRVDEILANLPEPPAFTLYTDGSGHADGFGGAAALLLAPKHSAVRTAVIAASGTTTERMEFEALLAGLQLICDLLGKPSKYFGALDRPVVHWVSDRESLVLAVLRDEKNEPIYRRKSTPDLWCRFEYYEKLLTIIPQFSKRKSCPHHDIMDKRASEARQLMKEYTLTLQANDEYV